MANPDYITELRLKDLRNQLVSQNYSTVVEAILKDLDNIHSDARSKSLSLAASAYALEDYFNQNADKIIITYNLGSSQYYGPEKDEFFQNFFGIMRVAPSGFTNKLWEDKLATKNLSAALRQMSEQSENADEHVRGFFDEARRFIKETAIHNVFNAAATLPQNAREVVGNSLSVLCNTQEGNDVLRAVNDAQTGAKLIELKETPDATDSLLIVCHIETDKTLTPAFMDKSLYTIAIAVELKAACFEAPIAGLTSQKFKDMSDELGLYYK